MNKLLNKISKICHKNTGYSLLHQVLECENNLFSIQYPHTFFKFNSLEWQLFIDFIEIACKKDFNKLKIKYKIN